MADGKEKSSGRRFEFGTNWKHFLEGLDEERIAMAGESLKSMLKVTTLEGKTFLDVGSGSGLFSLAARKLGARVRSFDYDPQSVACTGELRRRFFGNDSDWVVEEGSILDAGYLATLGTYDIVYSWGVLHHTGSMYQALENVLTLVGEGGLLFVAIYNNMGGASRRWLWVKKTYCHMPGYLSTAFAVLIVILREIYGAFVYGTQGKLNEYIEQKVHYKKRRGMSWWHDQIDWIGGFPYEDAKPEEVFEFVRQRGFRLETLRTCGGGIGCNEFVFARDNSE